MTPAHEEQQRLLEAFLLAAKEGKMDQFKEILAETVELYSDGGGKANALPDVLRGSESVGRFFIHIWQQYTQHRT